MTDDTNRKKAIVIQLDSIAGNKVGLHEMIDSTGC